MEGAGSELEAGDEEMAELPDVEEIDVVDATTDEVVMADAGEAEEASWEVEAMLLADSDDVAGCTTDEVVLDDGIDDADVDETGIGDDVDGSSDDVGTDEDICTVEETALCAEAVEDDNEEVETALDDVSEGGEEDEEEELDTELLETGSTELLVGSAVEVDSELGAADEVGKG